ncbi:MAG: apolipoprotein N-acyltransferase [Firmicutes bacterium]|nr:apolipoprotein N-acyltransferase [Bacillota bacterium]
MKKQTFLFFSLPLLSAFLLILAFPRFNLWYMAWFALIPMIVFLLGSRPGTAFWGGLVFGVIFHFYINFFVNEALFDFLPPNLALLAFVLLVIYLSLYYGLCFYVFNRIKDIASPISMVFLFSFLWILMEYLRSTGFLGYTAGYLGYTQWNIPFILRIASVYGYWGLPFLMFALQAMIALRIKNLLSNRNLVKALLVWLLIAGIGLGLPSFFPVTRENKTRNIALIQANISQDDLLEGARENLEHYENLSRDAAARYGNLDLIVWAETVLSTALAGGRDTLPEVRQLSEDLQTPIIYGAMVRKEDGLYNSMILLTPEREDLQSYSKKYLVPIVEYFPPNDLLNRWLNLRVVLGTYKRGKEINILNLDGLPLSGVICFESFFGSYTREFAARGAKHLFILTNDNWLKNSNGIDQHAHMVMIRAAEMGVGVTQVANSGITVSADFTGKELLRSNIDEVKTLQLETDFAGRNTVYRMGGDYFIVLGCLYVLFSIAKDIFLRRKSNFISRNP